MLLEKSKCFEDLICAAACWDWRFPQEGRRCGHSSAGEKTRLGVRQNIGPTSPSRPPYGTQQATSYYCWFAGTGFITGMQHPGEVGGINALAAVTPGMPLPFSIWLELQICGRDTQM